MLQVLQNEDCDQCFPNLDQERIGRGAHEGLDLEILLDRLEKDIDLPAVLVGGRNRLRPKVQAIGQQHDDLFVLGIPDLLPSQGNGILSVRVEPLEFNALIARDVPVVRNRPFLHNPVMGIALLAGYEEKPAPVPGPEEFNIDIAPVYHHDRAGRQVQHPRNPDLVDFPGRDASKQGQIALMVQ